MSPVGSIGALMGRIAAIENRLGIRNNPHVATTAPIGAPGTVATPGTTSAHGLADGLGDGAGFGELLEHAEQLITQAAYRVGASPFATGPSPVHVPSAGMTVGAAVDGTSFDATGFGAATGSLPAGTPFAGLFEAAAERWGIPAGVLAAVGHVESRFRTDAVSPAGAIGVMQFMPATAAEMGVDPTDPSSAIDGAARLLRQLQDRFGSLELALGAYNVGPGTITRAGGIVAGSQSEKYVNAVLSASEHYS